MRIKNYLILLLTLVLSKGYAQLPIEYDYLLTDKHTVKCYYYSERDTSEFAENISLADKLLNINSRLYDFDESTNDVKNISFNLPNGIFYKIDNQTHEIIWAITKHKDQAILVHHTDKHYSTFLVKSNKIISSNTIETPIIDHELSFYNLDVVIGNDHIYLLSDSVNEIVLSNKYNSTTILNSKPNHLDRKKETKYNCDYDEIEFKTYQSDTATISHLIDKYINTDTIYTTSYYNKGNLLKKQEILVSNPLRYYRKTYNPETKTYNTQEFKVLDRDDFEIDPTTWKYNILVENKEELDIENKEVLCDERFLIVPYKTTK